MINCPSRFPTFNNSAITSPNQKKKINIVSEAYELKKGDTAGRITMIMEQHSEEFRQAFIPLFAAKVDAENLNDFTERFRQYLDSVIDNIKDADKFMLQSKIRRKTKERKIKALSEEFGGFCVSMKPYGFKPEFFTVAADAITTECVFLDNTAICQSPTLTFEVK
ncbi:unnamed protein product [Enterobius vermicularis]|uniref:Uncharacterized protein n=1 Tax=Enterobius vermicularis TaxID=51028 RepID=A0A0N4VL08_ENTVE|nr:unnamed protein product [Enterobius vermicularis]